MNDAAVIALFDPAIPDTLRWCDAKGWHEGSWETLTSVVSARPWTLLVDGRHATLLETSLPANDLATARRAAPFAVEEQLAQTVEQTRVALSGRGAQRYALIACSAAMLDELGARLADLALHPTLVTAEPYAVPWHEQAIGIAVDGLHALVRCGPSTGFKARIEDLGVLTSSVRQQYPETATVDIYGDAAALPLDAFNGLEVRRHDALDATRMAAAVSAPPPPALLDASPTTGRRKRARRLWTLTAAAAALLLVAYPALLALGNAHLDEARRTLRATNVATFTSAFPAITRVVNPRIQAEQAMAELRTRAIRGPAFLELLADLDRAYGGKLSETVRVRSIAFGGSVLEISLETPDMNSLEQVRDAFAAAGMRADMLSAESVDAGVVARLRLGERS